LRAMSEDAHDALLCGIANLSAGEGWAIGTSTACPDQCGQAV